MKLKGKICIVTGAARGIGRQIAMFFAGEGSTVAIGDIDRDSADRTAAEIILRGHNAYPVYSDVSKKDSVDAMVDEVVRKSGRIDILVNNAAIEMVKPLLEVHESDWKKVLDVNLTGTFLCSQAVARIMIGQNMKGKIINISSIHYNKPRKNKLSYDASKAGIAILTQELALELAGKKINVNCIAPGFIKTDMNRADWESEKQATEIISKIPWGRMGETEDVAKLALFLASDDSEYITGCIIPIDGGRSLQ